MDWRSTPRVQDSIEAVGRAVADEFDESPKGTPDPQLARGYIGTVLDDATQALVVVVDPALVDMQRLASKLNKAAGPGGVTVRIEAAKVSASDLLAARHVIFARDWHPDASKVSMASYLDPAAGRYDVTFRRADENVALALQARLGGLVHIRWGTPLRR